MWRNPQDEGQEATEACNPCDEGQEATEALGPKLQPQLVLTYLDLPVVTSCGH